MAVAASPETQQDISRMDPISYFYETLEIVYSGQKLTTSRYMYNFTLAPMLSSNNGAITENPRDILDHHVYQKIQSFLEQHLMKSVVLEWENEHNDDVIKFYEEKWNMFRDCSTELNKVCRFLNDSYGKRPNGSSLIYYLAIDIWKSVVLERLQVITALLNLFRNGGIRENSHADLVRKIIESFMEIGKAEDEKRKLNNDGRNKSSEEQQQQLSTYETFFERRLLQAIEAYYEELLVESPETTPEYWKLVEQRLGEERRRAESCLPLGTQDKCLKACEAVLVYRHCETLINDFKTLLSNLGKNRNNDLCCIYRILCMLVDKKALDVLLHTFEDHIYAEAQEAFQDENDDEEDKDKEEEEDGVGPTADKKKKNMDKNFVTIFVQVNQKYKNLIATTFNSDPAFMTALVKARDAFIINNSIQSKQTSSEILARYCDWLLKGANNDAVDTNGLWDLLNLTVTIFGYLNDKSIFKKQYITFLATRLTSSHSRHSFIVNTEAEHLLIDKLKLNADGLDDCTPQMLRLLKDFTSSKDLNDEFKNYCMMTNNNNITNKIKFPPSFDFNILLLSSSCWPFSNKQPFADFVIPSKLVTTAIAKFEEFYKEKYKDRKLNWLYNHSQVEIEANCFEKQRVLKASTFQAAVLLNFNSKDSYQLEELAEATNLDLDILLQVTQSLVEVNLLVITANPGELPAPPTTPDLLTADTVVTLSNNNNFETQELVIDINKPPATIMSEKGGCEQIEKPIQTAVTIIGKHMIQATIIRVMKASRVCKPKDLVTQVIQKLPMSWEERAEQMIKKSINDLTDQGYMERLNGDDEGVLACVV